MGAVAELSSRAIRGVFYEELEQSKNLGWVDKITNLFTSDQASEDYKWLSQSPVMREWLDGKAAKGFTTNGITIANLHFEATIAILLKDLRRDKTGQLRMRMADLVARSQTHWASLISTLNANGETTLCYDGLYYYSASHVEGNSGAMSNLLTSGNYASLEVVDSTRPTADEYSDAIMDVISHFYSFKDDQGEPRNEDANQFLVQVPVRHLAPAITAVTSKQLNSSNGSRDNPLIGAPFKIEVIPNPRLAWTDKFSVHRTDGRSKPFIRQQETEVVPKTLGEGSDHEFTEDEWLFSIDAWRNVGYGMYWQSILATFSDEE